MQDLAIHGDTVCAIGQSLTCWNMANNEDPIRDLEPLSHVREVIASITQAMPTPAFACQYSTSDKAMCSDGKRIRAAWTDRAKAPERFQSDENRLCVSRRGADECLPLPLPSTNSSCSCNLKVKASAMALDCQATSVDASTPRSASRVRVVVAPKSLFSTIDLLREDLKTVARVLSPLRSATMTSLAKIAANKRLSELDRVALLRAARIVLQEGEAMLVTSWVLPQLHDAIASNSINDSRTGSQIDAKVKTRVWHEILVAGLTNAKPVLDRGLATRLNALVKAVTSGKNLKTAIKENRSLHSSLATHAQAHFLFDLIELAYAEMGVEP